MFVSIPGEGNLEVGEGEGGVEEAGFGVGVEVGGGVAVGRVGSR